MASNANTKQVELEFDGTSMISMQLTENNQDWTYYAKIIRATNATARGTSGYSTANSTVSSAYSAFSSIDYGASIDLKIKARTPTTAGDITVRGGITKKIINP
jgi:hypothetical protein